MNVPNVHGFCQRYKPKGKKARTCHWGSKLLAGKQVSRPARRKMSPGQLEIWTQCQISETDEVARVANQFVRANRNPNQRMVELFRIR